MADERLRIVIEALNKSRRELQNLQKDLGGVNAASKKASTPIGGLTAKLAGLVTVAAAVKLGKMIYELGVAGAAAERVEEGFERMAGGAEEAAKLLESLKEATMGTRSEVDLMAGATNVLALGLADDADQLADIMRTVSGLGARFGGNMQMFQLMMSNQSLRRVDSFGLSIEEVTARIDEFVAAGETAEEAFRLAVLDAMADKFEQLGGSVEDAMVEIDRGKAAFADLKTEAGKAFVGIATSVAGATGPLSRWAADVLAYTTAAREEFGFVEGSARGMAKAVGFVQETVGDFTYAELVALEHGLEASRQGFSDVGASAYRAAGATLDSADAWGQYSRAMLASEDAASEYYWELANVRRATEELAEANRQLDLERVAGQWDALTTAVGSGIGPAIDDYLESQADLIQTQADLETELADLETGHGRLVTVQNKNTMSESELELAQRRRAETLGKLNEAEEGSVAQARLQVQYEGLTEDINAATGAQTAYVDNSKRIGEVTEAIEENKAALIELEEAHTESTGKILFNFAQQIAMADEVITQEELDFVAALGEEYGILDEAGATALKNLNLAMGAVESGLISADTALGIFKSGWDNLYSKDVSLNVHYNHIGTPFVDPGTGSTYGGPSQPYTPPAPTPEPGRPREVPEYFAGGFEGWVNSPMSMLVGEGGQPEYVSVTPASQMRSYDHSRNINIINPTFQSQMSPVATMRMLSNMEF